MRRPKIISEISRAIKDFAPEAKSILYGSEARGDAREGSDIDLLILLPDSYEGEKFFDRQMAISSMLYSISLKFNVDISPLILMPKIFHQRKTPFTVNIANEGIEL